jgi:Flp pilus assembly pilin Flp
MLKLIRKFWHDDCGAVGPEWACLTTVLVLGSVASIMAAKYALSNHVEKAAQIVVAK